jgi:ribonuclease HI
MQYHKSVIFYTPNEGEAMAAKLAISVAKSLNMDHFIIEGDSEVVIDQLSQQSKLYSRLENLFFNTRLFRLYFLCFLLGGKKDFKKCKLLCPLSGTLGRS